MSLKDIDAQLVRDQAEVDLARHERNAAAYGIGGIWPQQRRGKSWFRDHFERKPEPGQVWVDEAGKIDASAYQRLYEQMQQAYLARPRAPMVVNKPLNEISNADLVMEMLKRGFAVMKLPDDGGPPEALRGTT